MTVNSLVKKHIITLVPIKETFFHSVSFNSEKKLSYESVIFNYQNLSPFIDTAVSYIQKDDKLLLWFYDKKYKSMFTVPEGYLYSQYFSKRYKDALINIENKAVLIIQNHKLSYQSTSVEEKDILNKKYNIKNTVEKSTSWHKKNYKSILNQSLIDLTTNFIDKNLLLKLIKEKLISLIIPTFIILSLMSIAHFFINSYLKTELDKLIQEKKETKVKTKEIFDSLAKNNQDIVFIKNYLKHHNQQNLKILNDISKVLKKHSVKLFYLEYNRKFLSLRAEAKDVESFLEGLSTIKMINSYKLTRQIKTKDGKKEIIIEIDLKQGKENEQ